MQDIKRYIIRYYKEEFSPGYLLSVCFLLIFLVVFNYSFQFEKVFVRHPNRVYQVIRYFVFYGIPFCISIFSYSYFHKDTSFIKKYSFWLLSIFMLLILSLPKSFHFRLETVLNFIPLQLSIFFFKLSDSLSVFFLWFCIPAIYWFFADRTNVKLYGFSIKNFQPYPYLLFVLLATPFIFGVSFLDDFSRSYPIYRTQYASRYLQVSPIVPVLAFELSYGLAFVATEFFFRGFLLFTFEKYLGKGILLPMVVLYCLIHFQKPLLEAIMSVFGGLLLGIIALYSRSIYGGIVAHIGIAWMMDLAGYYQLDAI